MKRSDKIRWIEIAAAFATGFGKFFFMDYLNWKLPFIVSVIFAWSFYIYYRHKKEKGILEHWGFRRDNFLNVMKTILPFALVSISLFFIIAQVQGTLNLKWYILILFLLYPIWGTFQHFLTIALVSGNLIEIENISIPKGIAALLSSILFAIIHFPDKTLMAGTFLLALLYNYIYFKERNLCALGIFHGLLGALFYYTIVDRDPFLEVFGNF